MAGKFDPEKFLTEEENDKFGNALLANDTSSFLDVLQLTFPELVAATELSDIESYKEWFLDTYDVHECAGCDKWCDDTNLIDDICENCACEDEYEDDDFDDEDENIEEDEETK